MTMTAGAAGTIELLHPEKGQAMIASWARPMLGRVIVLTLIFAAILGSAWALSGTRKGTAQPAVGPGEASTPAKPAPPEPAQSAAASPAAVVVEPKSPAAETPKAPLSAPEKPVVAAEDKPPVKDARPPRLMEVDLSKLPPDLVKDLQGAIVEKRKPDQK